MHGLMAGLARRHDVTAVSLVDAEFDVDECRRAMQDYCSEVILVADPNSRGLTKRLLQLRSLASLRSFEYLRYSVPELRNQLARLDERQFDVVHVEFQQLSHVVERRRTPGVRGAPLVIDTHEIAFDLVRQFSRHAGTRARKLYAAVNWQKLRHDEVAAFRRADGLCACSVADREKILQEAPGARTAVVPNACDLDFFAPRPSDPPGDGRTIVFFGLMSTFPNIDGVGWLLSDIWPRIAAAHPDARCKIIGKNAPKAISEMAGTRVEIVGFVEDLRPHLASAAALVVPLRLGGGTRLKIIEGMAMGKAVVSTSLGAEGLDVVSERDIVIADDAPGFARAVTELLRQPERAAAIGRRARQTAHESFSWSSAAAKLEELYREVLHANGRN